VKVLPLKSLPKMTEPPILRSPTDTIIAAMEEAAEATACLVIMTDKDGSIITLGSTNVLSTRLGLLEMAKAIILSDMIKRVED
jgi:hypothetical protein